jgi:glycosyltransferase involved in cell wall biosynthesis
MALPPVAIDYTAAHEQGGGIGRYVRELCAALARLDRHTDYRLFVAGAQRAQLPPPPGPNFTWAPTRIGPRNWARLWHRARLPLPVEAITGRVALFHATDFTLPPTLSHTRTLLTVHDLSFVRVPETASPSLKAYLDVVVPRSVRRADHILADSAATRDDLVALYGVPESKITVLLSGVDARFRPVTDDDALDRVRQRYTLPYTPFILSVGTVQPRKNYARLIEALARLKVHQPELQLVIVGGRGWLEDPIYAVIDRLDLRGSVTFTGFAEDDDLPSLYSLAQVVALPSLYEGFGLPVLEAMACGTPVVTSDVSSLPEVAGDAALLVDPLDVDSLTDSLRRLLEDDALRAGLRARGLARAASFTWERSARQLLEVYALMLSSAPPAL